MELEFQDKKNKFSFAADNIHQPIEDVFNGKSHFGGIGGLWRNWWGEFRLISKLLPQNMRDMSFIDVGCSAGAYCFLAKKRGAKKVAGVDITSHYLEAAQKFSNKHELGVKFSLQDVTKGLKFKDKEFDIATCLQTIEHSRYPFKILEEVTRISKESIISTPNYLFPTHLFTEPRRFLYDSHKFIFNHKGLRQLIEKELGSKVVYQNFLFSNIIVMKIKNS